jgi:hypothetical protein
MRLLAQFPDRRMSSGGAWLEENFRLLMQIAAQPQKRARDVSANISYNRH